MEFDMTWLLWGLPLAFAAGWFASRLDLRQLRIHRQHAPKAYFRGLNHLLNEQKDQAIDAFIEAVQGDPDTAELHFALGNLFRRRGDYDRAVRVHEHLLARADISGKDRARAQYALAMDFLKAGLLDRSETALHKLEGTSFEIEALIALLTIYERSRDWSRARDVALKLEATQPGSFAQRLAHYLCEEAELQNRNGHADMSLLLLNQAIEQAPQMPRAWLARSTLLVQLGQAEAAFADLLSLAQQAPQGIPLAAPVLVQQARVIGRESDARALLEASDTRSPSLDVTEALADLSPDEQTRRECYLNHLQREPSLVVAARWLTGETLSDPNAQQTVNAALEQASAPLQRYRCAACSFESRQYFWQCVGCQGWDTYPTRRIEEI